MTHRAPVPQPCPNRAPARHRTTVPPCPRPYKGHGQGHGTVTEEKTRTVPLLRIGEIR